MEPRPLTVSPGVRLALALARLLRAGARRMRHAPDRLLHPVRRRLAVRRVAGLSPRSVLIVCHSDLCRGPYAAQRLRSLLAAAGHGHNVVHSAGLLAPGHLPPANAVAVAQDLGLDLSRPRSRQLGDDVIQGADLVLAMEPAELDVVTSRHRHQVGSILLLGDFDPEPIAARGIPDPYGCSPETIGACYSRLDRCVATLASALGVSPAATRRRGDEAREAPLAALPAQWA